MKKTDDELRYLIVDLMIAIDGEVTYGDLWDIKEENQPVFAECIKILKEAGL